jgi:hypothetical protein
MPSSVEKNFTEVTEMLDGNAYERCAFIRCKLVYRGGPIPRLRHCTFEDCALVWDDASERTINFLRGLQEGMGVLGTKIVDDTFAYIRRSASR